MTLVVATAILALMTVSIAVRPLAALLIYGITATYADGFGVSQWLGAVTPLSPLTNALFSTLMNSLFLVLFARALFRLLTAPGGARTPRTWAFVSLAIIAWCLLTAVIDGSSTLAAAAQVPYLALPYTVVWLAFADTDSSKRHLIWLVGLQSALAVATLMLPGLSYLRGDSYTFWPSGELAQVGQTQLALPNAMTSKGVAGFHFAQFHNPNVLGLYATAALAIGVYLSTSKNLRRVLAGIIFLLLGLFMWANSLTRGPMIGLLIALALSSLFTRDLHKTRSRRQVSLVLYMIGSVCALIIIIWSGILGFLLPSRSDISVSARFAGFSEAWQLISDNPLFGVGIAFPWDPLLRPHFIGLLFGAQYGVVAGVAITWLVFVTGALITVRVVRNAGIGTRDSRLTASLFGIMAGIAATNNFTGPVLFAALLSHILIMGGAERDRGENREPPGFVSGLSATKSSGVSRPLTKSSFTDSESRAR